MIFALLVIVILLLVGLAMLANAQNVAGNARNTEVKTLTWDAAEAGLNAAMDKLDVAIVSTTPGNGTLKNTYTFAYTITPNFSGGIGKPGTDSTGAAMTIPPGMGYVQSTGTSPDGLRTAIVEAIIQPTGINQQFPNDAMDAGGDVQGNWNHKIGITECHPGKDDATVHANGNITATVGFDQGTSTASGTTDTLNPSPGGVNTPVVTLPTASMGSFVADAKTIAQAGGTSLYVPSSGSLPTTFACPLSAPTYGCIIFYDAALHISGLQDFNYTGHVVVVINGDYSSTGNSGFTLQSGQQSVFVVNGNADMGGNSDTGALYWVKGDTTMHGNGNIFGALVTGGNAIFAGGGSGGGFQCDPNALGLTLKFPGKVIIKSYAEY
ncbi:MAG TPA: hypothetical protein VN934_09200 [Candidatus Tumulicola sp.]|nr:hypothetical protein [Candidatus Tumulicola sp.]